MEIGVFFPKRTELFPLKDYKGHLVKKSSFKGLFIREIFDRGSRTGFLVFSGDHFLIFNKYDMFWSMLTSLSSNKLKHVLTSLILSKPVQTGPKLFQFVQTCLNLFKIDQTLSNLFNLVQTCSKLSKLVQTCPNLFKLVQTW